MEWQTIDSAPAEYGVEMLGRQTSGGKHYYCIFRLGWLAMNGDPVWVKGDGVDMVTWPTHWQPLSTTA